LRTASEAVLERSGRASQHQRRIGMLNKYSAERDFSGVIKDAEDLMYQNKTFGQKKRPQRNRYILVKSNARDEL